MSHFLGYLHSESILAPSSLVNKNRFFWFTRILGSLIVMNAIDGLFTIGWVYTNRAVEANPLMGLLINIHPVLFISLKMALVHLGSILLLHYCYKPLAVFAGILAFLVYWIVLLYHGTAFYMLGI